MNPVKKLFESQILVSWFVVIVIHFVTNEELLTQKSEEIGIEILVWITWRFQIDVSTNK